MKTLSSETSNNKLSFLVFGFAALLRILVAFSHYSGEQNYHGSSRAYGGDYEAQRHWMEITYHLPIGDWYWYGMEYWGLDYPPLTAYVSYVCGWFSHHLVGPESVALDASRGWEDPTHKAFMRATVLVLDLLIYGSAVWYSSFRQDNKSLWTVLVALSQPAIVLIDHGHFQYNTVALGLSLSAMFYMVQDTFLSCIYGSVLFCLALNFKQMTLYYAPAIFFYLLGRCMATPRRFVARFLLLGLFVICTFFILWIPFAYYGPSEISTTPWERVHQIIRRIFPFERGLFEGKVSNIWCALNTRPVSIRERIDPNIQPLISLMLTSVMISPSCYSMYRLGMQEANGHDRDTIQKHWVLLLWGTASCSLSFFLASFQVHEKSILLVLAPCALLLGQDEAFVEWFSILCTWSLWPLLQVDRLQVPYVCTLIIFISLRWLQNSNQEKIQKGSVFSGPFLAIPGLTYAGMIGLHLAELLVDLPANLPDLFPVLWSLFGCAMFSFAWLLVCTKLTTVRKLDKVKVH